MFALTKEAINGQVVFPQGGHTTEWCVSSFVYWETPSITLVFRAVRQDLREMGGCTYSMQFAG